MNFQEALVVWKKKNKPSRQLTTVHLKQIDKLVKVPNGCCYFCSSKLEGRRRKWCSHKCTVEFDVLCGRSSLIRKLVLKRDKGICSCCGQDCIKIHSFIFDRPIDYSLIQAISDHEALLFPGKTSKTIGSLLHISNRSLWDCDHIIAVKDGGGCCGLDNYQTLCLLCHKAKHKA